MLTVTGHPLQDLNYEFSSRFRKTFCAGILSPLAAEQNGIRAMCGGGPG
jgi:hypothetical protein